jgi:hypothetical protein
MNLLRRGAILFAAGIALAALAPSAEAGGPFQYYAITPCRAVDTRSGYGGIVGSGVANERQFQIKTVCGVPADALAVSMNVTAVAPSGDGYYEFWPVGGTPQTSTLNFNAGEPALANGAIFPLGPGSPDLVMFYGSYVTPSDSATGHVILDVTGYFK